MPTKLDISRQKELSVRVRLVSAAQARGDTQVLKVGHSGIAKAWRKERKRLSLSSEITLHTFRHGCATYVANLPGVPITELRDVLGHASVVVTEIYVYKDERELRLGMAQRSAELSSKTQTDGTKLAPGPVTAFNDGAK